jgi:hypothetical protein
MFTTELLDLESTGAAPGFGDQDLRNPTTSVSQGFAYGMKPCDKSRVLDGHLLDSLEKNARHRSHTLTTSDPAHTLVGRRLETYGTPVDSENLGEPIADAFPMRRQPRRLGDQGDITVDDPKTRTLRHADNLSKKFDAVGISPALVARGKVSTEVAETRRAQYSVAKGMKDHVRVAEALQAEFKGNHFPTED